ncbi:MAG: DNA recombination protein RmuC [Pseudomonadota bacterium]
MPAWLGAVSEPFGLILWILVGLGIANLMVVAALLARSRLSQRHSAALLAAHQTEGEHIRELLGQLTRLEERLAAELRVVHATLERTAGESEATGLRTSAELREALARQLGDARSGIDARLQAEAARTLESLGALRELNVQQLANHQTRFEHRQTHALKTLQQALNAGLNTLQRQIGNYLERSNRHLGERVDALHRSTDARLGQLSEQVEQRLADGFDKTTATFADIVQRLALIDDAQKKITELSTSVVSLQEILADKSARGAFGEIQLNALLANMLPPRGYAIQHQLSNGRIADCILFLPEPTGNVVVDSKFPLEAYQRMMLPDLPAGERSVAERAFKTDIRRHVTDIAERYIVPGETADGAVMFLPAEAVFAEIQAHHPDLVQLAHDARVWIASPTTLMAILNTARAVLKDAATRAQVDVIQTHLNLLARDFERFRKRMENLSRHIKQADRDVDEVHVSARKIAARFDRIERVDFDEENGNAGLSIAEPGEEVSDKLPDGS